MKHKWVLVLALAASTASLGACSSYGGGASNTGDTGYGANNPPADNSSTGGVTNEPRDTTGSSQYPGSVAPGSESGGSSSGGGTGSGIAGPETTQPGVTNEPRDSTGTSQYPGAVAPGSDQSSGGDNNE